MACPIYDSRVREKIHQILEAEEYDTLKARVLQPDGTYVQKDPMRSPLDSQQFLMEDAERRQGTEQRAEKKSSSLGQAFQKLRELLGRRS